MDQVTILGTGDSILKYGPRPHGEVWTINRALLIEQHPDTLFLFHPVDKVFKTVKDKMILKNSGTRIFSSYDTDFVHVERFPLSEIIEELGISYFKCTAAYALAYAAYNGYERVNLVGLDYTSGKDRDEERACVEFWIGFLKGRGIEVNISEGSALCTGLFYGYDTTFKYEEDYFNRT